jgi:PAS domain S-box-containing protein
MPFPPAASWWADAAGSFTALSPRWEQLTGRSVEKELGRGWLEGVHPDDRSAWQSALERAQPRGELCCDLRVRSGRGDWIWLRMQGLVERDAQGRATGLVGSATDVSDLCQERDQLRERLRGAGGAHPVARGALEELADAALHDLQEPLRNLAYTLEQLAGAEPGPAGALVRRARELAASLQDLLRHLLEYAEIGREPARLEPTDPGQALAWATDHLAGLIAERGARISVDALPPVQADPIHLARIFQNLLANALHHAGSPALHIEVSGERSGDRVILSVADNGVGIAREHRERVFQAFQRLEHAASAGRGIGLSICRKLVEAQGGEIWVEPAAPAGACFRLQLPAA